MILVSHSPRRKDIMTIAGYDFKTIGSDIDESYPSYLAVENVPSYLAEKKARSLSNLYPDEILIGVDTIVVLDGKIIGKPKDEANAIEILSALSGKKHTVITGVCVLKNEKKVIFSDVSEVYFTTLTPDEINYYIKNFKPFDKAGAYGVQDWIGMVAIQRIDGSFYNVMGLPVHKLYRVLKEIDN